MTNKKRGRGRPPKTKRGRPRKPKLGPLIKVHWVEIADIDVEQQKLIFSQNLLNWGKALRKYGMKKSVQNKKYRKYADTLVELSKLVSETIQV